jgi:hypothetical protein
MTDRSATVAGLISGDDIAADYFRSAQKKSPGG